MHDYLSHISKSAMQLYTNKFSYNTCMVLLSHKTQILQIYTTHIHLTGMWSQPEENHEPSTALLYQKVIFLTEILAFLPFKYFLF